MPKWPRNTSSYASTLGESFKASLKTIAEAFAAHERVDSVSKKHVDEAYASLARLGLHSKTWWQRSDTWTACGAFLFGIAFSMPDLCSTVLGALSLDQRTTSAVSFASVVVTMGLGLGLYFWAKHQGSIPKKPGVV